MTVYNGEHYLGEAIESLCNQSLRDIEIVIVDDGSTDKTPAILAEYKDDERIQILSVGRIGRAGALNRAWQHSSGRYIAVLDADDLAKPTRLEKQVAYLDEHPAVGVVGTSCQVIYDDGRPEWILDKPQTDEALRLRLVYDSPFVHSSVMIRRAAMEAVGGYDESSLVLIDYELWGRIARYYQLFNLPEVLTVKRYSRHAYFRHEISRWVKCKAKMHVRFLAWWHFSHRITDLRYVLLEPPIRCVYSAIVDKNDSA